MADRELEESRRYEAEMIPKLEAANTDVTARMRGDGYEVDYSPDEDFLSFTIGVPRVAESLPYEGEINGVLLVDPETHLILGLEIPFFNEQMKRVRPKNPFWQSLLDLLAFSGNNTVYIPPRRIRDNTEQFFGELALT